MADSVKVKLIARGMRAWQSVCSTMNSVLQPPLTRRLAFLSDSYLTPIPAPFFLRRPDILVGDQIPVRFLGSLCRLLGASLLLFFSLIHHSVGWNCWMLRKPIEEKTLFDRSNRAWLRMISQLSYRRGNKCSQGQDLKEYYHSRWKKKRCEPEGRREMIARRR